MNISAHELYSDIWGRDSGMLEAELKQSLHPRHADELRERMLALGLTSESMLLDIGARDGSHAVELARRSGCRAIVVDPVQLHVEQANQQVQKAGLTDRVSVRQGGIEAIPIDDRSMTHVWCRDMLNHVALAPGLRECTRVLQPGGKMLVYQTFASALLEPNEARRLYQSMAIVPENMQPAFFEYTADSAGLRIVERDLIASEWRERWIEDGDHAMLDDLLMLARLQRHADEFRARSGEAVYEATYGGLLWGFYQMIGKLCPTIYVLEKQL